MEELDGVLASLFKHEIPHYEFKPLQTETYPPKECEYFSTVLFFYYIPISDFLSTYVAKKLPIVLHNSYLLRPYYNGENI